MTATSNDNGPNDNVSKDNDPHDDTFLAAIETVHRAISQFEDCSDEEREELQHDLDELGRMAEKLESGRVEIVVFGEISTGKSALVNALVGDDLTQVNVQGGWTKDLWQVPWEGTGYCVPGFAESEVVLVDTPGLNEVAGAERAKWLAPPPRGPTSCCSSLTPI